MKSLAILAILIILAPIASYGQAPTNTIIIETFQNSKAVSKSTDIFVTIKGQLEEEGLVKLFVSGKFASNSVETIEETYTLTQDNPTHVFELDYKFLKDETYIVTVQNGLSLHKMKWTPLSDMPEKQKQVSPAKQDTSKSNSNSNKEASSVAVKKEQIKTQDKSGKLAQSLREENSSLKQTLEKKNAVIMEQIKLILDLASKITNTIYEEQDSEIYFVADSSKDLTQSLKTDNELLKKEIEKKNAVIMEQFKVIQDLASKITNTIYEPTSSYLLV